MLQEYLYNPVILALTGSSIAFWLCHFLLGDRLWRKLQGANGKVAVGDSSLSSPGRNFAQAFQLSVRRESRPCREGRS
jgi:hypothetical protein